MPSSVNQVRSDRKTFLMNTKLEELALKERFP
jgi:hypothetical protein